MGRLARLIDETHGVEAVEGYRMGSMGVGLRCNMLGQC